MEYAKIVAEKSALRSLARAAAEITAMIREGPGDFDAILEGAEQKIYAVRKRRDAKGMVPVKELLPGVLDRIGEMSESETHLPGLSTGLPALDRKIMGLDKSDLILLAARPGMGKTTTRFSASPT